MKYYTELKWVQECITMCKNINSILAKQYKLAAHMSFKL